MDYGGYTIFRASARGRAPSLLHVRSTGHYRLGREWRVAPMRKNFIELFWCVSGTLYFPLDGKNYRVQKDEVFILLPGDMHDFHALTDETDFCWFTIDGPDMDRIISGFGLEHRVMNSGHCPETLFSRLFQEVRDASISGELRAGRTGYDILSSAFAGNVQDTSQVFLEFERYVELNFMNPQVNVDACAAALNIHRTTLIRAVTRQCRLTPQEYLASRRMQEALRLLYDTIEPIEEVARRCGFGNANYFSRAVRKRFGNSPRSLRKRNGCTDARTVSP